MTTKKWDPDFPLANTTDAIVFVGLQDGTNKRIGPDALASAVANAFASYSFTFASIAPISTPSLTAGALTVTGNGTVAGTFAVSGNASFSLVSTGNLIIPFGTATGTNTYTVSMTPAPGAGFVDTAIYCVAFTNANTGASTLNGATIQKAGAALVSGDIPANSTVLLQYRASGPTFQIIGGTGSGGGGVTSLAALTKSISQTGHGFVVGNVLRLNGAGTYTKAQADNSTDAEVSGIVSSVTDANNFVLTILGYVSGLSGLIAQTVYFLDPATPGAMTATEPSTVGQVSKPLLVADSTTSGYFVNLRGEVLTSVAASLIRKTILAFSDSTQSTKFDSTSKLILGEKYFDPNDSSWGLNSTSSIVMKMLLGTSNGSNVATGDLFQQTGTGSPAVIATTATVSATTATLVSLDVSSTFRPGGNAGIYAMRCWINTFNGNDQATCYGAWLEVTP